MSTPAFTTEAPKIYTETGPDKLERETLYWQLMFLSTVLGRLASLDDGLDETDIAGLASLIGEIAHKVFPEQRT